MAASAGTVTLDLDANSVRLIRELQKSSRATQKAATGMRRDMQRSFNAIKQAAKVAGAALATFATGQLAFVVRKQLDLAGNLQRVADTVGFTAEQVQEYRFAAEQLNLSTKALDLGLQRFSRRVAEAARGQGELLRVTQDYDVKLKDSEGRLRDSGDILEDFADIIANTTDEQEQLRIAFKLFDSEGAGLVRLLRSGSSGLTEFKDRARDAGIVLSNELVDSAAEADRVLVEVSQTLRGRIFRAVAENADEVRRLGEAFGRVGELALDAVGGIQAFFAEIQTGIAGARGFIDRLLGADDRDAIAKAFDDLKSARAELESLLSLTSDRPDIGSSLAPEIAKAEAEVARLEMKWKQLREAAVSAHHAQVSANVATAESARIAAAVMEDTAVASEALSELDFTQMIESAKESGKQLEDWASAAREAFTKTRTPAENFVSAVQKLLENPFISADVQQREIERLRDVLHSGLDNIAEDTKDITDQMTEFSRQAARNMQDAFADFLFDPFKEGLDGMLEGFLDVIRRMVANQAAASLFNSLGIGSLFSGFGAASAAGAAAASVGGTAAPRLASGGLALAGKSYVVGDGGEPELFTPGATGFVTPLSRLKESGGTNVSYSIHVDARADREHMVATLIPIMERTRQRTISDVQQLVRDGALI